MSNTSAPFTEEQIQYLAGFTAGSGIARSLANLPTFANTLGLPTPPAAAARDDRPPRPEDVHLAAQDRFTRDGKKLCNEEVAKRTTHGLDVWDKVLEHARDARFPKGTDVFLFKFLGLFYVAPAQDSFMCRLRFPAGIISSHQMRGLADLADRYAGGFADVTTRANFQLREIRPENTPDLLMGLNDVGIVSRGAGADNVRNITANPTSGFDRQELLDVRPLARKLHHHILHHRELFGLPRKFNIAFDSGGSVTALEDTNDIGFAAVRVGAGRVVPPGIYFRMNLGGITGHLQFARDTGILLKPDECVPVADAALRAFIEHGDRTDRKKARLKYVLDRMGYDGFVAEIEKYLGKPLTRVPLDACEPRLAAIPGAHVGVHRQKQDGLFYVGALASAGRFRSDQLRALADIADEFGQSDLRLTVYQNLIIPHVAAGDVETVKRKLEEAGLAHSTCGVRAGLAACTGNAGCKFANSNTKLHALAIADHVEAKLALDQPVNVHLTGCPNSCAQHYIGDVGLLGTKVTVNSGEDVVEGYHVFVGGSFGARQDVGRELYKNVPADKAPEVVERMLRSYTRHRSTDSETFADFVRRHPTEKLLELFDAVPVEAA